MGRRLLLLLGLVLGVLAPTAAYATYGSSGLGSGTAAASSLNQPTVPTVTRGAGTALITWSASKLANGANAGSYDVIRHVGTIQTTVCAGTMSLSCTDASPLASVVSYGIVARVGSNWRSAESATTPFTYDTAAPTTTLSTTPVNPDGANGWFVNDVSVTLTGNDNGSTPASGVKEIHYTVNGGAEQVVAGTSATFTVTTEQVNAIAFWAVDNNGNTQSPLSSGTVKLDKTKPNVAVNPPSGATTNSVTITASDAGSGIAHVDYVLDGVAATGTTVSWTAGTGATHTLTYSATDNAGNTSSPVTATYTATSTLVAPTVTCGATGKKSVTMNWSAVSGATSYDLYFPNTSATPVNVTATTFSLTTVNQTGTFQVKARNASGTSAFSTARTYDVGNGSSNGTCS